MRRLSVCVLVFSVIAAVGFVVLERGVPDPTRQHSLEVPWTHRPLPWESMDRGGESRRFALSQLPTEVEIELPEKSAPRLLSLRVEGPVRGFWADTELVPDSSSIEALLGDTLSDGMSDAQKAETLWRLVMRLISHGPRPFEAAYGNLHPLHHLTSYGYGQCGESTSTLVNLWEHAGLRARTWALTDHVAPEVFVDDTWRLYDADERCTFPDPKTGQPLGVEDLVRDPALVRYALDPHGRGRRGQTPERLERIYTLRQSLDDYYRFKESLLEPGDLGRLLARPRYFMDLYRYFRMHLDHTRSTVEVDLREGETLVLFTDGQRGRFALPQRNSILPKWKAVRGEQRISPARHGNGALLYAPRTADGAGSDGILWSTAQRGFTLRAGAEEGGITWSIRSPFLITDASVSGVWAPGGSAVLGLQVRLPGGEWMTVGSPIEEEGEFMVDLDPVNSTDRPQVVYGYELRVTLRRRADNELPLVRDLQVQTDVQVNPAILPVLGPGLNRIRLHGESSSPRSGSGPGHGEARRGASVSLRWIEDRAKPLARPPARGRLPSGNSPCWQLDPDLVRDLMPGSAESSPRIRVLSAMNIQSVANDQFEYLTVADAARPAELELEFRPPAPAGTVWVTTRAEANPILNSLTAEFALSDGGEWKKIWAKSSDPYPEEFPNDTADISGLVRPGEPFRVRWRIEPLGVLPDRKPELIRAVVRGFCSDQALLGPGTGVLENPLRADQP